MFFTMMPALIACIIAHNYVWKNKLTSTQCETTKWSEQKNEAIHETTNSHYKLFYS